MQILITGGAGFIGSNLCEYFVGKGFNVVCLDNLSTGFMHNIEPLMKKNIFRFIKGDMPHSHASILRAQRILSYQPKYDALSGFEQACDWYWNNLK